MDSNLDLELGLKSWQKRPFVLEGGDGKTWVEQVDRISDLPDHIIAQVLSCLGTKEAIRTSILSSRWRYLWKDITRIRLIGANADPDEFTSLVEHVLQNCSSTNLLEFDLSCPTEIDLSRLNTWVETVLISHKMQKLHLWINKYFYELPEPPLPLCILSCNTLVVLKLDSCFDIQIPESVVCFPCLKLLDIDVIFPDHEGVVNRLLSCCPVLENLDLLSYLDSPEVLKLEISSPTLRKLNLGLHDEGDHHINEYDIIIDTPNLKSLSIEDDSFSRCVVKNLTEVYNVVVDYRICSLGILDPEHINRLLEVLKGISAAEVLTVHWNTAGVLGSALSYVWPTFPYMMTLILQLSSFSGWTWFSKVLHSTPNLEFLILDLEGINDVDNRDLGDNELYRFTPPDSIPNCLLKHVELIGIQHFEGNKDEAQVVEYLLNNAQMLECMMIGYDPDHLNEDVLEKLITFQRASKTCDLQIYERVGFEIIETGSLEKVIVWGI